MLLAAHSAWHSPIMWLIGISWFLLTVLGVWRLTARGWRREDADAAADEASAKD